MSRIRHALIMAAGRGLRMMPLTGEIPKAMAPFNGSTLVRHGIDQVKRSIEHVHITVGYKGAMLAEHVMEAGVSSVFNTSGQSNSWWIYNTLMKYLDEAVFVLTCDNATELDFDLLEQDYFASGEPACMLVPVKPVPGLEGDYIFARGNIVTEVDRHKRSSVYCSGIQVLNPRKLNVLTREGADFYALWRQLIAREQLLASRIYPKRWLAIDTVDQLREANEIGSFD